MIFIIGGNSQGKLDFAGRLLDLRQDEIADGGICGLEEAFSKQVLNNLHVLIKRMIEEGRDPLSLIIPQIEKRINYDKEACVRLHEDTALRAVFTLYADTEFNTGTALQAETALRRIRPFTVISDELSSGVIPVRKKDRKIQELAGRVQCEVARRSEYVYRVFASIPLLIKGNRQVNG